MTDLIGKLVLVDGKKALVSKDEGDHLYLYFEQGDVGWYSKSRVVWVENITRQSPQDSLTNLQKLCTTNDIHILISKNDYQIWDSISDDTYEMDNAEDMMKAIECLNELKKWRQ